MFRQICDEVAELHVTGNEHDLTNILQAHGWQAMEKRERFVQARDLSNVLNKDCAKICYQYMRHDECQIFAKNEALDKIILTLTRQRHENISQEDILSRAEEDGIPNVLWGYYKFMLRNNRSTDVLFLSLFHGMTVFYGEDFLSRWLQYFPKIGFYMNSYVMGLTMAGRTLGYLKPCLDCWCLSNDFGDMTACLPECDAPQTSKRQKIQ